MSKSSKKPSELKKKTVETLEAGGRRAILEDLFYDFHRSRSQVFAMNFLRGLFFGLGSVLGATIVVGLLIWLLGQFGDIFPPLADFVNNLTDTMQQRR